MERPPPPPPPAPPPPPPPGTPGTPPGTPPRLGRVLREALERAGEALGEDGGLRELLRRRKDSFEGPLKWLLFHRPVPPLIQDGPQCGLVALAMAGALLSPPGQQLGLGALLETARARGFTRHGEMFSAAQMAALAQELLPCRAELLRGGLEGPNRGRVLRHLLGGLPLLVPYDEDSNHAPCCRRGHKAHWALINGVVLGVPPQEPLGPRFRRDPEIPNLFHARGGRGRGEGARGEGGPPLGEGGPLFGEGASLLGEGGPLFGEGASLLGEGGSLLGEGGSLFGGSGGAQGAGEGSGVGSLFGEGALGEGGSLLGGSGGAQEGSGGSVAGSLFGEGALGEGGSRFGEGASFLGGSEGSGGAQEGSGGSVGGSLLGEGALGEGGSLLGGSGGAQGESGDPVGGSLFGEGSLGEEGSRLGGSESSGGAPGAGGGSLLGGSAGAQEGSGGSVGGSLFEEGSLGEAGPRFGAGGCGLGGVLVLAVQGKSPRPQLWGLRGLHASNAQLSELSPRRWGGGFVLPPGGVAGGLRGRAVLLHPLRTPPQ